MNIPFFKLLGRKSSGFASIDIIRGRLEQMDFVPVTDIDRLRRAQQSAIISNEIEGNYCTVEEVAFHELMLELRVPYGPIERQAKAWLLSFMLEPA